MLSPLPPRPRRAAARRQVALLLLLFLCAGAASAQYFGRNKVRWRQFDFWARQTEHFEVWAYPRENRAAADAARMAERWYARLSDLFDHRFRERKPVVLYSSHAEFQQTNVTGGLIGEGVGGFTEPMRSRVVLPLTGNYADTDHVLGHELVHEFQYDIAQRMRESSRGRRRAVALESLPLWVIEGQAEYFSKGRNDPETAMWLRDAVLRKDMPDLRKLSRDARYFPYRWGEAVWAYVGGRWGDRAVVEVFVRSLSEDVESAVKSVLGVSAKDLARDWHEALRAAYEPILAARVPPRETGRELLTRGNTGGELNLAPTLDPDGRRVALISSRSLFTLDLYVADVRTGRIRDKVLSAASDPHLEALRFIDSAGSWSPDGTRIATVGVTKGRNQIFLVDVASGRVERRIDVEGVGSLTDPAWSPDGRSIAVSGTRDGVSDLYVYDLETGRTRRLTDDLYGDLQPAWSPDGSTLAFVSDRGPGTDFEKLTYGPMRVCLLDVRSGAVRPLAPFPRGKSINPQFAPSGRELYFIADPDGVDDVFRIALPDGPVSRVTAVATGISGITRLSPALSVAGRSGDLAFSVFRASDYAIHSIAAADALAAAPEPKAVGEAGVLPPAAPAAPGTVQAYLGPSSPSAPAPRRLPQEPYRSRLELGVVGPATVGVSTGNYGTGFGGGASAYFTDLLGDQQLVVTLQGGAASGLSLSQTLGGEIAYLNQARRLQFGGAYTHLPYLSGFTIVRSEPTRDVVEQVLETITVDQVSLFSQYPFSQTRRVEAGANYTRQSIDREFARIFVEDDEIVDEETGTLPTPSALGLYGAYLAYVEDSSFFGFTSPVRGSRMRLELGSRFGSLRYETALADARRYFFFRPVTVAVRALHYGRYGSDAESPRLFPLFVGDETLVRGYGAADFSPSECTSVGETGACPEFDRLIGSRIAVANLELRLPLLGTDQFGLIDAPFLPTELALFVDGGVAWNRGDSPRLRFERESVERVPVFSAGVAARVLLGGVLPLQFYYARPFQRPRTSGEYGFLIAPGW